MSEQSCVSYSSAVWQGAAMSTLLQLVLPQGVQTVPVVQITWVGRTADLYR
jgi:hypothetical protein